jgi:hypothetical protein
MQNQGRCKIKATAKSTQRITLNFANQAWPTIAVQMALHPRADYQPSILTI